MAAFWESDRQDAIIEYIPSAVVKHGLKKRGHTSGFQPLSVRLVKCKIEDETHVYATTLMDQAGYLMECFADLYHGRWGIEELYTSHWKPAPRPHGPTPARRGTSISNTASPWWDATWKIWF